MYKRIIQGWLKQRLPAARSITLNQRRIFILPSRIGLVLFSLCALLFLIGINFQNSLVYIVCFWLIALLVINILYTYRNLSGLHCKVLHIAPCFAGDKSHLTLEVSRPAHSSKQELHLGWAGEDQILINLDEQQTVKFSLSHSSHQRGYFTPPRLDVFTLYPTGLTLAWSYLSFDIRGIVYPKPAPKAPWQTPQAIQGKDHQQGTDIKGQQDFHSIRDYQAGDSLRHIHWRKFAQTGQLHTKQFSDALSPDRWLNWDQWQDRDTEQRLSLLCRQILDSHEQGVQYGLSIPGTQIEPASGEAHRHHCLTALALYGSNQHD